MNKLKVKKIKKFLKEKWYIAGGSVILLIIAAAVALIGFNMTGWNIIVWLKSPYALTCFILLFIGIIVFICGYLRYKQLHLGEY